MMKMKILSLLTLLCFFVDSVAFRVSYGTVTCQNERDDQQDRYLNIRIAGFTGKKKGSFFAVYDGHGGDNASSLLERQFHKDFTRQLRLGYRIPEAFERAFRVSERDALAHFSDGSVAAVAYVDDKTQKLSCALIGDCRIVVDGDFETKDQKPDSPDEKKRIEDNGGQVVMQGVPRVNWNGLAVPRAIGDRDVKRAFPGQIIATPECVSYQLTPADKFMIVATDGLWHTVTSDDARALVRDELQRGNTVKGIARSLAEEAIKRGSQDNITVTVVKFTWPNK
jgi:serine/threonine protein phosphatase PrpC